MNEDLSSEFEFDAFESDKKRRRLDLTTKEVASTSGASKESNRQEWNKESRKQDFLAIDAYSRHKMLVNEYLLNYPGATKILKRDTTRDKTDMDIIKENHRFLWAEDDELSEWGVRLAKRYCDKLFKEYCIADLSQYKENKIALRWRTEQEVITGKGQFCCGNKHCDAKNELTSWELNFAYVENNEKKNALVKLRLCPSCSNKLNHNCRKKAEKRRKFSDAHSTAVREISIKKEVESPYPTTSDDFVEPPPSRDQLPLDNTVWSKPLQVDEEKNREEEFQGFLEELLL